MNSGMHVVIKFAKRQPKTYPEMRDFIEKERPDWLQALMPRRIHAPSDYWSQKVLPVSAITAALTGQIRHMGGLETDLTSATIEAQMGLLLKFDVPTFYVSKGLLAASARTDLPDDMFLDAIPFPFPGIVFMLPKGTISHLGKYECPYIVVSRSEKGQVSRLPLKDVDFQTISPDDAIIVSTFLPDEICGYHKAIRIIPGEKMKSAFDRCSKVPFQFCGDLRDLPDDHPIATTTTDVEFADRLWLLVIVLTLIMASGENLLELGKQQKTITKKTFDGKPVEYWSPNYLGWIYEAPSQTERVDEEFHRRPHWRKGHLKSQPYGPQSSLRKIIWIQPYRTGAAT
jgi:hypothetical protein